MPLHPIQELPLGVVEDIKIQTKLKLVKKARADHPGTKPENWVARELVYGPTPTTDWVDLTAATGVVANCKSWSIDQGDKGAALTTMLAANSTIPRNKYVGIFGFFDLQPEVLTLPPITDVWQTHPTHALNRLAVKRGESLLEHWQPERCYAYDDVVGITDRPVVFGETDSIDLQGAWTDATEDSDFGWRGYIVEKVQRLSPQYDLQKVGMGIDPSRDMTNEEWATIGGMDPYAEVTPDWIHALKNKVMRTLKWMAVRDGIVTADKVDDKMYVRELLPGDGAATDKTDLNNRTAQLASQQNWAQDDDDLTAYTLSSVIDANEEIADQTYVGFYGFCDHTNAPSLTAMRFKDGGAGLDFYQVEHAYAYHGDRGGGVGFFSRPIYYGQNKTIDWQIRTKIKCDQFIEPLGLVLEPWGKAASKA